MLFLPEPRRSGGPPSRDPAFWRWLLFAAAATVAVCATLPWIRIAFPRLFQEHFGPPAWHSSAGFTCLCTSLLVWVMALAETQTSSSRLNVRPGSLMLVVIASLTLLLEWLAGPGSLGGVSARWTGWFYVACAGLPLLLTACVCRCVALRARRSWLTE
jgi:hypothetical protein